MKRLFIFAFASFIIFSACHEIFAKRVHGNGNIITQSRTASQFNSIEVSGNIDIYAKQDSANSIKVETDENLQEYIETVNDGGILRVKTREGYNPKPTRQIKVYVSSPVFKIFKSSGACDIYGEGKITSADKLEFDMSGASKLKMDINAPDVSADLSGATNMVLTGETKNFKVRGTGSSDIKCLDLMAENSDIHITGAGDAEVYASVKLNVDVTGAGSVKYKGNASVSQSVSGAGSVKKIE